jgi:hypothetical protein
MAKSRPEKARAAAEGAWGNQYVQRFIQDEQLRDNVRVALDNARDAYARLTNGKSATKVVMEDKKFQKNVKQSADALKEASTALREGPKRKRGGGGLGKLLLLAIVGGGLAIALSEDVRNKVLDLLFGKEEEFDYTATSAPASPPPATPTATAST